MTLPELVLSAPQKQSAYHTGHCANGNHEGSKNKASNGNIFPSCRGKYKFRYNMIVTCCCWCHEMFEQARALTAPVSDPSDDTSSGISPGSVDPGAAGLPIPSPRMPERVGMSRDWWQRVTKNEDLEPQLRRMINKIVLGVDEPMALHSADKSRRARGSLDINVEAVCRLKFDGYIPQDLTPQNIGMLIDALNPPSAGAIHAVFTRWSDAGYCELSAKPLMLTSFTSLVGETGISGARRLSAREKEARSKGFF